MIDLSLLFPGTGHRRQDTVTSAIMYDLSADFLRNRFSDILGYAPCEFENVPQELMTLI